MISFHRVPDSELHGDPRQHLTQDFEPSVAVSILDVVRGWSWHCKKFESIPAPLPTGCTNT